MEHPSKSPMQYAMDALQAARESGNAEFYLYICAELGQLGVLTEPRYLFEVYTEILKDVQAIEDDPPRPSLRFSGPDIRKAKETILQSLANTRVLYRQHVDEYLWDELEHPGIYAQVITKKATISRLPFFLSWAFEQLTFRSLTYFYDEMGSECMQSLLDGARCRSTTKCVSTALSRVLKHLAKFSE
jgi:hypothetical protein